MRNVADKQFTAPNKLVQTPKQEIDCDSFDDIFRTLWEDRRWTEFAFKCVFWATIFLVLCVTGCVVGVWRKPGKPSYWANRPWNIFYDAFNEELDVTTTYQDAIQELFDLTTLPQAMGVGRDGSWATHRRFKVLRVTRIENGKVWSKYAHIRSLISKVGRRLTEMPKDSRGNTGAAMKAIDECLEVRKVSPKVAKFVRSLSLDDSRNEIILFHGSPGEGSRHPSGQVLFNQEATSPRFAIKKAGFDDRLGNVKGMYGSGTYFADMVSKADQYAGRYNPPGAPGGSVGEQATIFLARVTLGSPYLTNKSLPHLRRPPCIEQHFDLNLTWSEDAPGGQPWREKGVQFSICDHPRFDSVVSDFLVDNQPRMYRAMPGPNVHNGYPHTTSQHHCNDVSGSNHHNIAILVSAD